jgi:hypothetical protein
MNSNMEANHNIKNVCNEHLDENTNLFKEWKRIESKHGGHLQDHNVYMDFKRIGW